jgi:prepilin-type processing-associated H-X9-DG protein
VSGFGTYLGLWAAIACFVISLVALVLWLPTKRRPMPRVLVVVLLLIGLLLIIDSTYHARQPGGSNTCRNNLRNITLALLQYEQRHGSFPPAYIADESGQPMHSWRTLILPRLERDDIYAAIRWDEPWDGPNNRGLAQLHLDVFACPSQKDQPGHMTNYVAVVGPNTAWGRRLDEITDGLANTILLVEVADSGIAWMEPRDLHVTQMAPGINPKPGQGISSHHPGGVNAAFADGHVRFISADDISPEELEALLTIDGGETVDGL